MTCCPASAVSARFLPATRGNAPARSWRRGWAGLPGRQCKLSHPRRHDFDLRAPSPGRAQVPRPTGPFPAGGSEPSRPPLQGTGTPRPGLGALGCLRRGAGMDRGSPLRPRSGRAQHTRCSPVEGGRSECIGAVRLSNPEDVLVGCADGFERVNVLLVDVVRGPQNMHDGNVGREP